MKNLYKFALVVAGVGAVGGLGYLVARPEARRAVVSSMSAPQASVASAPQLQLLLTAAPPRAAGRGESSAWREVNRKLLTQGWVKEMFSLNEQGGLLPDPIVAFSDPEQLGAVLPRVALARGNDSNEINILSLPPSQQDRARVRIAWLGQVLTDARSDTACVKAACPQFIELFNGLNKDQKSSVLQSQSVGGFLSALQGGDATGPKCQPNLEDESIAKCFRSVQREMAGFAESL